MRKKRRKPNPWVTWESDPAETAGNPRHVIRGETLPPDTPVPPPAPAPESAPPPLVIPDPIQQIIADFGESPAAPEMPQPQWRGPASPPPASPPPAAPPAPAPAAPASPPASPPPSWGRPTTDTRPDLPQARPGSGRRRVTVPRPRVPQLPALRPPRLPVIRRPRLPVPVRHLPAPPWWVLPAAARWTRRQVRPTARAALWVALGAVGVLAGVAAAYGLTRVAALRWDIALPTYAVVAGIAARLIQETPRLLTRWTHNRKGTPR